MSWCCRSPAEPGSHWCKEHRECQERLIEDDMRRLYERQSRYDPRLHDPGDEDRS